MLQIKCHMVGLHSKGSSQVFQILNNGLWDTSLWDNLTATVLFYVSRILNGDIWSFVDNEANIWKPVDTPSPASRLSHNGCAITPHKIQSETLYLYVFWVVIRWEVAHYHFVKNAQSEEIKISKINSRRQKAATGAAKSPVGGPKKAHKDEQKPDLTSM